MDEWPLVTLGDLVEIKHGYAFKGDHFTDISTGDFVLTPGNFAIGGGFQWTKAKYYSGEFPEEFVLSPGDIIVTMTDLSKSADTLGYSARIPATKDRLLHNQRLGKVVVKSDAVLPSFVHWVLRTPEYRDEILASYTGSTVKHTSPKKIKAHQFRLPPMDQQNSICSLLDALERKIYLNAEMSGSLEDMARAQFKDWFVDFGPVRAKMEGRKPYLSREIWDLFPDYVDETDRPRGWSIAPLSDEFRLTMGQSPPGESYNSDKQGVPFFQGRSDFGARYPQRRMFCTEPTRMADEDDTIVSVRAPVGEINMAFERSCIGRGLAAVRHRLGGRAYTFQSLTEIQREIQAFEDTGTVFGSINKKQFSALSVIKPSEGAVKAFDAFCEPFDERIKQNVIENSKLAQIRDLLLPRLMSGEISIQDAESEAAEVV